MNLNLFGSSESSPMMIRHNEIYLKAVKFSFPLFLFLHFPRKCSLLLLVFVICSFFRVCAKSIDESSIVDTIAK